MNETKTTAGYVSYKIDDINSILMLIDSMPISGINSMKNLCKVVEILQNPITPEPNNIDESIPAVSAEAVEE